MIPDPNDYFFGQLFAAEDDTYTIRDILADLDTWFHAANLTHRPTSRRRTKGRVRLRKRNLKRAYKAHLSI